MHLLRHLSELSRFKRPISIALGVFDGVHLGHQAVIKEAVRLGHAAQGDAAVITFHPHPAKILRPKTAPLLLTTEQQDYELFSHLDVDASLILDFTHEFSLLSAQEFLAQLRKSSATLQSIVVGPQWHFGRGREGNFKVLKSWADSHSIKAIEIPSIQINNETISSTLIRSLIATGKIHEANVRLGRPYQIVGRVIRGAGIGTKLGFPTANLDVENELIPAQGVYAARVLVEDAVFAAAVNIGTRPTVSKSSVVNVEAHLLDFSGDLSNHHLRLDFLHRIRDERKFNSLKELQAEIRLDSETAMHLAHL